MVGLPRSGKSTQARKLSQSLNAPIVEPDAIRLALHGTPYREEVEPLIHAFAGVMVRSLFHAGHKTVILDECGLTKKHRKLATKMGGTETLFVPVLTPKEVCQERAVLTQQEYLIPVIEQMAVDFEPLEGEELENLYRSAVEG